MRVAVVSQYYAPEDARIPTQLAQELAGRGHSVRVITAFPSYPHGRLFAGFRQRWMHVERDGGAVVRRVPSFLSHSENPLARMVNYLSFAVTSSLAGSHVRGADVVYVYATQMTAAAGPLLWRLFGGSPYILHVQDLWPESVTQSALVPPGRVAGVIESFLSPILRFMYRHAAATIAIAPTMKAALITRGSDEARTHVVLNWANESLGVGERTSQDVPLVPTTKVVYAGNLGRLQDLGRAIEAAARLVDVHGFTLTLVGSGTAEEALREAVSKAGASNIRVMGRVPEERMNAIYAESDFQLVTLKDLPIFRGTIPSKLQASLAHGVPVITNIAGDVAGLVEENRLGISCDPGSIDALEEAFRAAHAVSTSDRGEFRERCKRYYREHMSLGNGIDQIESILQAAAVKGRRK